MRRFPRAIAALLAAVLVISPIASAEPILPKVLDDHIGDVDEDLQRANTTYGERDEFQRSQASLSRASLALLNDAWVVSLDELIKAKGGLETGKARAQAGGAGADQDVVDHGRELASEARSQLSQVRGNLESMERTGLEPVAFAGGLAAAHAALRAMDLLDEHQTALDEWEKGNENEQIEIAIVSGGAGAKIATSIAASVLADTTEARANASATQLLSPEDLDDLAEDRVGWVQTHSAAAAQRSQERVTTLAEEDERLMTLSAYTIYFQDVAFNGVNIQQQRGEDVDAYQEARDLYERDNPRVEAWIDLLDVPGDLALGGMASADFSLVLNQNATGESRQQAGAYALGLAHFGAEHAGLLQQAFGAEEHSPGAELAEAETGSGDSLTSIPAPGLLASLAALAFALVALGWRRDPR